MPDIFGTETDPNLLTDEERRAKMFGAAPPRPMGPVQPPPEPTTTVTAPTQLTAPKPEPVTPSLGLKPQSDVERIQAQEPKLGGWRKGLDVAGQILAPGIEEAIPGTEGNWQRRLGQAKAEERRQMGLRKSEADIGNVEAEAGLRRAETQAKLNPPPQKPENIDQEIADAATAAQSEGRDPNIDHKVLQLLDVKQRGQKETAPKPDTQTVEDQRFERIVTAQKMGQPVTPEDAAWSEAYKQRKTLGPALTAQAAGQRQQESFTQQEKMFKLREEALTAATKGMIEMAPTVLNFADRIDPLIDKLNDELGPSSGRWSEFMTGKVGSKNPEYTKLRTDVGLLRTALMRMHVGSRGAVQMMEYFKGLLDQGKQDPENLKAALAEIRQYAHDLIEKGKAGGMSGAVLVSGSKRGEATAPPREAAPGMKWQQNKRTGEFREVPVQ
jgi:hypothetical protein